MVGYSLLIRQILFIVELKLEAMQNNLFYENDSKLSSV